jgi:nuclear pore complex protein Nup93
LQKTKRMNFSFVFFIVHSHYLLAGKGFDADRLSRNLNSINIKAAFEPAEPLTETDLDAYLKHEYDLTILTSIEEAKKEVGISFINFH